MIAVISYIYITGCLLVALRLAWHLVFAMDQYDRRHSSAIYSKIARSSLLWPLLLLDLSNLVNPSELLTGVGRGPEMVERARLVDHPPNCSQTIRYCPTQNMYSDAQGEFLFLADEAVSTIRHAPVPETDGMLFWLSNRDPVPSAPTDVPPAWDEFKHVASRLLREGKAQRIHCRACQQDIAAQDLLIDDAYMSGHQCADRYACPVGHTLLLIETMRVIMRPPSQEPAEMDGDL